MPLLLAGALLAGGSPSDSSGAPQLPTVRIQALASTVAEGGTNPAAFVISRKGGNSSPIRVEYLITGTAVNGRDYVRLTGSVTLAGQQVVTNFVVPINNEREESPRTVTLTLTTNTRPFTIAVLPDTQYYVSTFYGGHPDMFTRQTRWIADERDTRNILFALHEGDCTQQNTSEEWQMVRDSMSTIDGVVPYALAVGNHDGLDQPVGDTALFNTFFPVGDFQGRPTFGGVFESNKMDNCYHLFTGGGVDWLVLSYEFGPRDEVLAWANQVVAAHPARRVMLVSHTHVYSDDTLHGSSPAHQWTPASYGRTNNGVEVWDKFIKLHANISFVFNGHVLNDGAGRLVGIGDAGNKVYQMLANYQSFTFGGNGYLRIIEFDPGRDRFSVQSYSPYVNYFLTTAKQQFAYEQLGIFDTNLTYEIKQDIATATITILDDDIDTNAPVLLAASASGVPPEIVVRFNEPLEQASAQDTLHYLVTPGVNVTTAALGLDLQTVTLGTDTLLATGVTYTLTVTNVRDRAASANPVRTNSQAQFVYFPAFLADDFEAGTFDDWTVVDEGERDAPSNWVVRQGRLLQSANIYGPNASATTQRHGTFTYWNHPASAGWSNYTFQVTVNTTDDDGLGVLFRYQDAANYYKLELDRQRNFHKLFKKVGGVETELASEPGGYPQNQDIRFSVETSGNQMAACLDGTLLFGNTITDGELSNGTVALYTWGSAGVIFDNVLVAPAAGALPSGTNGPPSNAPPAVAALAAMDSEWRYWPFATPPAAAWTGLNFNDEDWLGPAPATFAGDGAVPPDPPNTALTAGPVTHYFRRHFNFTRRIPGTCLRLRPLLDDGAIFYLNGVEILRTGMPPGPAGPDTLAARDVGIVDYEGPFDLPVTNLLMGTNVLAVELHQSDTNSADAVFAAEVEAIIPFAPPAQFSSAALRSDGQLQLTLPGEAGRLYLIEASPDLASWVPLVTRTNHFGTPLVFALGAPDQSQRFYRAVEVPPACPEL